MPAEKCNINSVKFMDAVLKEEIYLPRMHEMRLVKIAKPPTLKELKAELITILEGMVQNQPGWNLINVLKQKEVDQ